MAVYTHRVQSVLTQEQYEALVELSQSTGKPLSVLIREAVEKTYLDWNLTHNKHDLRSRWETGHPSFPCSLDQLAIKGRHCNLRAEGFLPDQCTGQMGSIIAPQVMLIG